ncbi:MAG: hypothetical protein JJ964_15885 [Rhizobiales bacterium]|nr:hypothetical protein [Hyphomicrobiales bacterium]
MNYKLTKQMNLTVIFVSLIMSLTLHQAKAEEVIPSLLGTWSGKNNTVSEKKGYKTRDKTIQITEQKDRRFKGYFTYSGGRVDFFGVIYPDNKSITWVSPGSRGYNHGRILSKVKIAACFVESGIDATAGCATLKKIK